MLAACWLASGSLAQEAASPLPKVPEGFAIELLEQAPELRWPSAVHCRADGSLLVGEDPMDMPGPSDEPLDRVLLYRWRDDGSFERTVFASELFAVFGLEEIDGAVFVMNMPHLTVLRDSDGDGVADERRELLTDLGQVAPGWPGGFNDHIVSGIRLGTDGWLYVSVGDKGVPHATGTDGSQVTLRGGGVLRVRPDGSQLEIVASGTRNHLDVALDADDEIFVHDNTDDGLGWWTRLTHVIPTGRYGYPWDYGRHPERALPPMADYGGGSPTGGLVYLDAVWPDPYRESLFFCEWAKKALRRFVVEREGSSFRVVDAEDFASAGALESFRPTDVCASPDGRFLYVADWGYGGWKAPDVTGRLFRVRRADDRDAPRGVTARFTDERGALAPFRARRLAQRALAARGDVQGALALLDPKQPVALRKHAIWALEAIANESDRGDDSRRALDALRNAAKDAANDVRAQAARALGSRRTGSAAELVPLLDDPEPFVRRQAATALGRIGDASACGALVAALVRASAGDDLFLRAAIREALRAIPRYDELFDRFPGRDERERLDLELALRERYELGLVRELAARSSAMRTGSEDARALCVELLASAHRKEAPWDGVWWGTQPAKQDPPAKTVDWEGTELALGAVRAALSDPSALARRAALDAVASMPDRGALELVRARWKDEPEPELRLRALDLFATLRDEGAVPLLGALLADERASSEERRRAIEAASAIATPATANLLATAIADPRLSTELAVACLGGLARVAEPSTVGAIEHACTDTRAEVRCAAARSLAAVRSNACADSLRAMLRDDPDARVRAAAATELARLGVRDAVPEMLELVEVAEARDQAIAALARLSDARALSAYLAGLESRDRAQREVCTNALRSLRVEVRSALEGLKIAGELSDKALAQIQAIYLEPRPIAGWTVVGPIAKDAAPSVEDGPPEIAQGLALGETHLEARAVTAEGSEGRVDLRALLGDASDQVAYATCELESAEARRTELVLGSDDSLALWSNGASVYDFRDARAWGPDQARVEVELARGANRLVARIGQVGGDWAFSVKVGQEGTGPLFDGGMAQAFDVRSYREHALANEGDPVRGRALFLDETGAACVRCHALAGEGGHAGPDLGDVGARYSREELVTSVLEPSARVADGYRTSWFELAGGGVLFGQVQKEEDGVVWLVDTNGRPVELSLAEVEDRGESPLSLMPERLTALMSPQEFSDLVSFLQSLRGTAH